MRRDRPAFFSGREATEARCLTEEQARKKDCCVGGFTTGNRGKCVASECMGWRWMSWHEYNRAGGYDRTEVYKVGYCGRAGKV